MKGDVDLFHLIIANIIIVGGFMLAVFFINDVSVFNAVVTKPSIENLGLIDKVHQIENCLGSPEADEIQSRLKECRYDSQYVEIADLEGNKWEEGIKEEVGRDHAIWMNIKNQGELKIARLYVKI